MKHVCSRCSLLISYKLLKLLCVGNPVSIMGIWVLMPKEHVLARQLGGVTYVFYAFHHSAFSIQAVAL